MWQLMQEVAAVLAATGRIAVVTSQITPSLLTACKHVLMQRG